MATRLRYCDEVAGWDTLDDSYDHDEKYWEEKENRL